MSAFKELKEKLKGEIKEYTCQEAKEEREKNPQTVILDVREKTEWEAGHIANAQHLSRSYLELKIEEQIPDKDTPIICQCGGGTRSLFAARALKELGYSNVSSMNGGWRGWKESGFETD